MTKTLKGWRPAETIPQDGSDILCATHDGYRWRFWLDRWRTYPDGGSGLGPLWHGWPMYWTSVDGLEVRPVTEEMRRSAQNHARM